MAFYPFTFLLFSSAPFDPHTQLSLKCRYDHLCCRLDAERGGVDDQVVAQRVGHIVAKDGAIQVTVAGFTPSTMTLIQSGNGNPFRFTSVAVGATSVTLVGTIDLQSLLGL